MLETIAKNDKPITHGVGAHRDNGNQISLWCKKQYVGMELYKLISKAKFNFIIMSYSDAGIMDKQLIENIMKRHSVKGTYQFKWY